MLVAAKGSVGAVWYLSVHASAQEVFDSVSLGVPLTVCVRGLCSPTAV
jgi:hypothetical protein